MIDGALRSFHPTLPNEPLIFVEVALVQGLSESIEPIIDATLDLLPIPRWLILQFSIQSITASKD